MSASQALPCKGDAVDYDVITDRVLTAVALLTVGDVDDEDGYVTVNTLGRGTSCTVHRRYREA